MRIERLINQPANAVELRRRAMVRASITSSLAELDALVAERRKTLTGKVG